MKKVSLFLIIFLAAVVGFYLVVSATILRKPAVAGTFYPADKTELKQMVTDHLAAVKDLPQIDGQIIALIVPHAGLVYSGPVAAYGYKLLTGSSISKVIICGPSHRSAFDGISVYGQDIIWQTPLGDVSCDNAYCSDLLKYGGKIESLAEPFQGEHCLEVQLPYLQTVLDSFTLVPVIIGYQNRENIKLLADALKSLNTDNKTIMVASTDWQHYNPASVGWKMDSIGMECLTNLDPVRLEKYLEDGGVKMCGGGAAVAVMKAAIAKGANRVKILRYGDSGDITGDKSSVVGYVAAVLYKSSNGHDKSPVTPIRKVSEESKSASADTFQLSDEEKNTLLEIARQTLQSYLSTGAVPAFDIGDNLRKNGAAFVTLEKAGQLRGCIGHTTAVEPLYKTVSDCAIQAAVSDPRFPPVGINELDRLHIEISVLTPMQKVKSLDEIKVGRDGLMIFKGSNRGLLLPQVATDYGWSETQFLEQTCVKAGLPVNAYKSPDAVIYRFQAVVFGE